MSEPRKSACKYNKAPGTLSHPRCHESLTDLAAATTAAQHTRSGPGRGRQANLAAAAAAVAS